jgi:hypothetical protein
VPLPSGILLREDGGGGSDGEAGAGGSGGGSGVRRRPVLDLGRVPPRLGEMLEWMRQAGGQRGGRLGGGPGLGSCQARGRAAVSQIVRLTRQEGEEMLGNGKSCQLIGAENGWFWVNFTIATPYTSTGSLKSFRQ